MIINCTGQRMDDEQAEYKMFVPVNMCKAKLIKYLKRNCACYTQNKRRVVIALVSPISAFDSPWCYIGPIGSITKNICSP